MFPLDQAQGRQAALLCRCMAAAECQTSVHSRSSHTTLQCLPAITLSVTSTDLAPSECGSAWSMASAAMYDGSCAPTYAVSPCALGAREGCRAVPGGRTATATQCERRLPRKLIIQTLLHLAAQGPRGKQLSLNLLHERVAYDQDAVTTTYQGHPCSCRPLGRLSCRYGGLLRQAT